MGVVLNFLEDSLQDFITLTNDISVEARLILNTIAMVIMLHLLVKRVLELKRRDFIFPFRIGFLALVTTIFIFSIPVEWHLVNLYLGIDNFNLQNLARIAGGVVIFSVVITLEVIDTIISIINARTRVKVNGEEVEPVKRKSWISRLRRKS